MKLENGINTKCSNEDYHADREYISSSGLKLLLKDAQKFHKVYVLGEEDAAGGNQAAFDFGSFVHCMILEPHLLEKEFAIYQGATRRGAVYEAFLEENLDKIIITQSQKILADKLMLGFDEAIVDIEGEPHFVAEFYRGGDAEYTVCTELDGIKVKVRTDYLRGKQIHDIKTTSSYLDRTSIEKTCAMFGYDTSAALYVDTLDNVLGGSHSFYFTFLSKKDGTCKIYKASEQMIESGRKKYKEAIKLLKRARKSGVYFSKGIEELDAIEI